MAIGIIQAANGSPVRQDASGADAEVKTGPYLLSDGVSLVQPIPVVIVEGESYTDDAGNLRAVWQLNMSGVVPVPVNTGAPTIGGTPTEGVQLSGTNGTWTNSPTEFEYMWRIGSETEGTAATFTPGYATAGEWCSKWVRARQAGGIWSEWVEASDNGTVARARWCKLTAGTANLGGSNVANGYCDGTGTPPEFGSIDREPIAGETLIAMWRNAGDSQFVCGFAGDKTALLAGQSVYLDSREFKGSWTYYDTGAGVFGVPVTLMLLSGQSAIAQPQVYDFRIAPASP